MSGVLYRDVVNALQALYPPDTLEERNAVSRTDGYWPYIQKGDDPPLQYTYGEFDVIFFAQLLDRVLLYQQQQQEGGTASSSSSSSSSSSLPSSLEEDDNNSNNSNNNNRTSSTTWNDKVFLDLGSGTGRLVMAAAALHPGWKLCRGIEILPTISQVAQTKLDSCCRCRHDDEKNDSLVDSVVVVGGGEKKEETHQEEEEWVENEVGLLVKKTMAPKESTQQDSNKNADHRFHQSTDNDDDTDLPPPPATYSMPYGSDTTNASTTTSSTSTTSEVEKDQQRQQQRRLPLAPIEFVCGSFDDPYTYFGDADCVFCFSSCMSPTILQSLSQAIGRQCRPGTMVITTDFSLPLVGTIDPHPDDPSLPHGDYELELLEPTTGIDGYCWLTGGQSTAYIHRVKTSLWEEDGGTGMGRRRFPPELSVSEKAYRAIKAVEEERDEGAVIRFLSGVRNNMFFAGFPEHWLPDPTNYQPPTEER